MRRDVVQGVQGDVRLQGVGEAPPLAHIGQTVGEALIEGEAHSPPVHLVGRAGEDAAYCAAGGLSVSRLIKRCGKKRLRWTTSHKTANSSP